MKFFFSGLWRYSLFEVCKFTDFKSGILELVLFYQNI
jgi:hypothetical protein